MANPELTLLEGRESHPKEQLEDGDRTLAVEEEETAPELSPELEKTWGPCLVCDLLERCGIGQQNNPINCRTYNSWLAKIIHGENPEEEDLPSD